MTAHIESLTQFLVKEGEFPAPTASGPRAASMPLLASLLDAIDTVVFVADPNGTLCFVNAAWSRLTGFSLKETRSLLRSAYLHPQDQARWLDFLEARRGEPQSAESAETIVLRFLTRSGETMHLEAGAQAVIAENDRCIGFVGTLTDVGTRVRAESMRAASHRTVETLINNLPGFVYRCRNNRQWTMEYMSKGCERLTGYPTEALINSQQLTYADLIVPEDREQVWNGVQISLCQNVPFELEYRIRTAQGIEKWVHEYGKGNFSISGELLGVEGFVTDLARQRREPPRAKAPRDPGTRLPDRAVFLDRLEMALRRKRAGLAAPASLAVVRLAGMPPETAGRNEFSESRSMDNVAGRIDHVLEAADSLCAWREGEFVVLHEAGKADADAADLAARIKRQFDAPIIHDAREIYLIPSIGILTNMTGNEHAEDIVTLASKAAREASNVGGVNLAVIDMRSHLERLRMPEDRG
ncbi:PAS domain-containing protein [Methyloligella solikamskensis]|uniref:PAS domain-containing protein n=1 Tax=Methyloligella solikamskensis TaxID=1177756 RepID=A0ABW3J9D1_9HYPH